MLEHCFGVAGCLSLRGHVWFGSTERLKPAVSGVRLRPYKAASGQDHEVEGGEVRVIARLEMRADVFSFTVSRKTDTRGV